MDCLFCKIIEGAIPSKKVYEDDVCLAFYDINPMAPVHVLVIPKIHIDSCNKITAEHFDVLGHIFVKIPEIAQKLNIDSYRVVSNCGADAGQTVNHLHFHILGGRVLNTEMA